MALFQRKRQSINIAQMPPEIAQNEPVLFATVDGDLMRGQHLEANSFIWLPGPLLQRNATTRARCKVAPGDNTPFFKRNLPAIASKPRLCSTPLPRRIGASNTRGLPAVAFERWLAIEKSFARHDISKDKSVAQLHAIEDRRLEIMTARQCVIRALCSFDL